MPGPSDTTVDPRTALWLEYAWAVVTGNLATAAAVAEARPATPDPWGRIDDVGELPGTAGWFGPGWAPGGVACLEELDDAAVALDPETWATLADGTETWRRAGRHEAADAAWYEASTEHYGAALEAGTWQPTWFGRFWDLAGVDPGATVLAVAGAGPAGLADAVALAVALRPNLVLTTSARLADGLHHHAPELPAVAFDAADGTRLDGPRRLGFNQWALAAATLLR